MRSRHIYVTNTNYDNWIDNNYGRILKINYDKMQTELIIMVKFGLRTNTQSA